MGWQDCFPVPQPKVGLPELEEETEAAEERKKALTFLRVVVKVEVVGSPGVKPGFFLKPGTVIPPLKSAPGAVHYYEDADLYNSLYGNP